MGSDIKNLPQVLLEENAQLEQRNRFLNAELEHAYAHLSRMEQSTSLRLGKILLECRKRKELLSLPRKLWQLRKEIKENESRPHPPLPVFNIAPPRTKGSCTLSAEQIYKDLQLTEQPGNTIAKTYEGDRCILSGTLPDGYVSMHLRSWYEVDGFGDTLSARLDFSGNMSVIAYISFYNADSEKIIESPFYRKKTTISIPDTAKYFSFSLRIKGSGKAVLASLHIANELRNEDKATIDKEKYSEISPAALAAQLSIPREYQKTLSLQKTAGGFVLTSSLAGDKHVYLPVTCPIEKDLLQQKLSMRLDTSGPLHIMGCITFLDGDGKKLAHAMFRDKEESVAVPEGCAGASLSLRIRGAGKAEDVSIALGTASLAQRESRAAAAAAATIPHTAAGLSPVADQCRNLLKDNPAAFVSRLKDVQLAAIQENYAELAADLQASQIRIPEKYRKTVSLKKTPDGFELTSALPRDKYVYLPVTQPITKELLRQRRLTARLIASGTLHTMGYITFLGANGEELSHTAFHQSREEHLDIPEGCTDASLSLRLRGAGKVGGIRIILGASLREQPEEQASTEHRVALTADELASRILVPEKYRKLVSLKKTSDGFALTSALARDKHIYLPVTQPLEKELLRQRLFMRMEAAGTLHVMGCVTFLGADGKELAHATFQNREESVALPQGCTAASLSLRIRGAGKVEGIRLVLGTSPQEQAAANAAPALSSMTGEYRVIPQDKTALFTSWLKNLRIAAIMDEFTWQSYAPEAIFLQLTPDGWHDELEHFRPDLLFVESAWRGKDELWRNSVHKLPPALFGILHWCGNHQVPTVFWNKEDPVHFETFINTAALFDFVFTYDFNCVPRYKTVLGHDRVYYLPMAVQPAMFNPVEKYQRKDGFCYAGSYYARYPERTRVLEEYIQELPQFKPLEIYDRQYGGTDPDYMFPPRYLPLIKGKLPYDQIDKAYKGYRYAINLSSMNQAQILARRVYELMASNTLVVSAYSRGVQVQTGELTLLSDSAKEIIRRIRELEKEPSGEAKLRLAALRKVMSENTYQDRLAYIIAKICNMTPPCLLPPVHVVARAETRQQAEIVCASFDRQTYPNRHLLLVSAGQAADLPKKENIRVVSPEELSSVMAELPQGAWLACFAPEDFYGANYLMDLALATRYATAEIVGKACFSTFADGKVGAPANDAPAYAATTSPLPARRAMAALALLQHGKWRFQGGNTEFPAANCFSIDRFNYLENGAAAPAEVLATLCDKDDLDTGIPVAQMQTYAEQSQPISLEKAHPRSLEKQALFEEFASTKKSSRIRMSLTADSSLHIESSLPHGTHEYIYGKTAFPLKDVVSPGNVLKLHLRSCPGLNLEMACFFLDEQKQKLQSANFKVNNINAEIPVCADTAFIRFALRISGSGTTNIERLLFEHYDFDAEYILGIEETLIVTNNYPSYDNLYKNGFVHSRVRAYRRAGVKVSVYQFHAGQSLHFDEFEGVSVFRGGPSTLRKILAQGKVRRILVHFLDAAMWDVLKEAPADVRIIVWVHGAEIQPWTRRIFNYTTPESLEKAKEQSNVRMAFWKNVFGALQDNIHFVFVSRYLADEVMEDNNIVLPSSKYSIIHNPIDTDIFSYHEKNPEQRYRLLSIRSFGAINYANDLTVKCILNLSRREDFNKFSILIVGDGPLFDEIVEPLRHLPNVRLENTFLTHAEIVSLHKNHGIFLIPTRTDTQGVSRDEAMASGLVPVTNAVTAIPEFVDETCGILAPAEDAEAMAAGISRLVDDPALFLAMSKAAAERIQRQTAAHRIIAQELTLIMEGR